MHTTVPNNLQLVNVFSEFAELCNISTYMYVVKLYSTCISNERVVDDLRARFPSSLKARLFVLLRWPDVSALAAHCKESSRVVSRGCEFYPRPGRKWSSNKVKPHHTIF